MHKSLFRWRLGATVLIICLMLAFNTVVILAQDATDEPPVASTEPTETETPLPIPTDTPTVSPTVEEPTLAPTDTPVEVTEAPVATEETVTPEATDVATQEVTEAPPAETPTVVAPVAEEPALSLLVRELFDNGDLTPWLSGAGWSLVASENGQALQVVNSNDPIVLQKGAFYNVAVQTRFLWTTGSAQISVRRTAVGNYTASIDANGGLTLKRGDDIIATSNVAPVAAGTWRTLRLSAMNDVIRVAIDDVEVIVYSDVAPLPPGDVSLSADFNPAAGDTNPTPETQTLLADDFFLWVPLAELGLYPAPTPIAAPTVAPTEPPPTEVPTDVVVEVTAEPTEVVVVPTEEATEAPAVTEAAPVELSGPYDDLTEAVGKDVSEVAPPSPEEIANAQDVDNDDFANRQTVTLNSSGFFVFPDGNITSTLEGSEPVPVCGTGLGRTDWFSFTPATAGTYTFSTAGSSFDTIMGIYKGTAIGSLTALGCNDDASATVVTSQLAITVSAADITAAIKIQIQVGGFNGRFGAYTFRVQQGVVPTTLAAPVLVTPAAGITSNQPAPTFIWNKIAANANSYEVQIATNAAFTTGLQSAIVSGAPCTTTCSYVVAPALPGPATYYWRVRGRTLNDLPGAFSAVRTFIYRTAAPTLNLPAANAVTTNSKQPLSWVAYPGASYTIQIDDDPGFGSPTAYTPAGVAVTFTPPTSLVQGDWYWRVKATPAVNSGDTAYSDSRKFTVNISSLPANNAVSTLAGVATTANVTFKWIAVVGATGYSVIIDNDSDFSSPLPAVTPSPATALTVTTALPAGVYYWYVKPTGFVPVVTDDTDVIRRKVTVSPPAPAVPAIVNPPAAAFTNSTTPLLDWSDVTGADSYDVQVCATATCTTTIYASASIGSSQYTPPALAAGLYNWRVRAVNSYGVTSAYSAARTFTVRTSVLSAPANNFVTTDTTPGFTWLAISYPNTTPPVKYQLEIDNDPGFGSVDRTKTGLTTLTYMMVNPPDVPLPYGTWYWRVLVDTGSGYQPIPGDSRTLYVTSSIPVAPTYPTVPAAGAVLADTTPHLDVNDVVPPVGASWTVSSYEFQVATNATFTLNLLPFTSATSDFTASALTPGAYFFRARAINSNGAPGVYSAARSFTIRTLPPVLSTLADGVVTTDTTPAFTWVTFGTGSKYNIQIDDSSGFGSPVGGTTTNPAPLTTTSFTSPVLAQGVWYWRVQAIDVQNNTTLYSEYRTFYVSTSPLLLGPVLVSPVTGFATNPQPTLVWNAVATPAGGLAVDHYQVQIATNTTFTLGLQTSPDIAAPTVQYTTTGLLPGTYYWRVRGFNTAGIPGAFSLVRNFIIDATGTLIPSLTLPADNSSSTVKTPTFTWTKPVGAVKFELRYSSNFPAGYVPDTGFALNSTGTVTQTILSVTTYKPPSPLIPGTYYWQVRAFDAANNPSTWTNLRTFKITSALTDTPQPNRFGPADTILLTWGPLSWVTGAAAPDGGYYEVQIDDNTTFASPEYQLHGSGDTVGTGVTYAVYVSGNNYGVVIPAGSLPAGLPNGTWYWRVRGYNPNTNAYGAYSSMGTFVVDK